MIRIITDGVTAGIELDGVDISRYVRSYSIMHSNNEMPIVHLELMAHDGLDVDLNSEKLTAELSRPAPLPNGGLDMDKIRAEGSAVRKIAQAIAQREASNGSHA